MSKSSIKSFGILINNLSNSQSSCMLATNINKLINEDYTYSPIVFYQNIGKCSIPLLCCSMYIQQAWGFKGTLISTDITTTTILDQCLTTKKKLFYVFDLEWITLPNLSYSFLKKIYDNPTIELLARSQEHFDILTKVWKKPQGILHEYNCKELIKFI